MCSVPKSVCCGGFATGFVSGAVVAQAVTASQLSDVFLGKLCCQKLVAVKLPCCE